MTLLKIMAFFALSTIGGMNILYIILRGMAFAPALKWPFTRFFVYEPGIGFLNLVLLLLVALGLRLYLILNRNNLAATTIDRTAWALLILLLGIEGLVIADFEGLI